MGEIAGQLNSAAIAVMAFLKNAMSREEFDVGLPPHGTHARRIQMPDIQMIKPVIPRAEVSLERSKLSKHVGCAPTLVKLCIRMHPGCQQTFKHSSMARTCHVKYVLPVVAWQPETFHFQASLVSTSAPVNVIHIKHGHA